MSRSPILTETDSDELKSVQFVHPVYAPALVPVVCAVRVADSAYECYWWLLLQPIHPLCDVIQSRTNSRDQVK